MHRIQTVILAGALLAASVPALAAESLFTAETLADGTLYSDQVARQVGDIITIRIIETTQVSESQKTNLSRENDISASVKVFPNSAQLPAKEGSDNHGTLPAFAAESKKEFDGKGDYQATGKVSATISGRVVDVLENGNLVIEARRAIHINDDTKTILLTGICRTADIEAGNTVLSERVHNFQVSIVGEGPLSRSQQEGILGKLIDILWPL